MIRNSALSQIPSTVQFHLSVQKYMHLVPKSEHVYGVQYHHVIEEF